MPQFIATFRNRKIPIAVVPLHDQTAPTKVDAAIRVVYINGNTP